MGWKSLHCMLNIRTSLCTLLSRARNTILLRILKARHLEIIRQLKVRHRITLSRLEIHNQAVFDSKDSVVLDVLAVTVENLRDNGLVAGCFDLLGR